MRRLILLRHAKSSWSDHFEADHDRPLNSRGRSAADAMGHWLSEQGGPPDQVLCSTAARTVETFERVKAIWPTLPAPELLDSLYHADLDQLYATVSAARGATVMIVGHNPGLASFAFDLVSAPPDNPKFPQFPTAAALIVDFAIDDWPAMRPGTGQVLGFMVPKDLPNAPESD